MKARFWRLTLKELRETLRDRRTVGTLVLMPLLVYPLLGIILQKFLLTQVGVQQYSEYIVCVETPQELDLLRNMYRNGNRLLSSYQNSHTGEETSQQNLSEKTLTEILKKSEKQVGVHFELLSAYDAPANTLLENHVIDLAVRFFDPAQKESDAKKARSSKSPSAQLNIEILYVPGFPLSENALYHLQDRLDAVNQNFVTQFLKAHDETQLPVEAHLTPLADQASGNISIATVIPLILILMTVTGAVYPAIDLTAGERERQTLEMLISAPIPRISILQAKYIAVLTVAMLTAMINLGSMLTTIYAIGVDPLIFGEEGVSFFFVLQMFGVLFLFASFFSSVLLSVTSFARSFKEAQAYLIPLMLISLAPGVFCLLPGFTLSGVLAWVPLINIVLLGRDLFEGNLNQTAAFVVLISSLIYTWFSLFVASRIFGTDAILYGSEGSWADLWKSARKRSEVPSFSGGLLCLAILLPVFLNASRILTRVAGDAATIDGSDMYLRSSLSALVTIVLFAGLPILFTTVLRATYRPTLALRAGKPHFYVLAIAFALSAWPFLYEMQIFLLPESSLEKLETFFSSFKKGFQNLNLGWKLFAYAVVPATCEELFFRGFLFSSCRTKYGKWSSIFLTAFLFGLFHVLASGVLFERFFPSFALGILLGLIRFHSASLFPGMLFHVLHNGLLSILEAYEKQIASKLGWANEQREHLPWEILCVSALIAVSAATAMFYFSKKFPPPEN